MTRRPNTSLAGSPVLVGAISVLLVIVAVYLSYNANTGLPFVPSSELVLQLENGVTVGPDSDVREGGQRVGVVREVRLGRLPDGRMGAEAVLKLDKVVGKLPSDSTFAVRLKGAIGGKYIEIQRGRSSRPLREGAVVGPQRTSLPVELDDVLSAFDAPTRDAGQQVLRGIGGALADRGPALNATLRRLPDVLEVLHPVMGNLAAKGTGLERALGELADVTRVVAPVAGEQAGMLGDLATTFEALARDRDALQDTITEASATLTTATPALRTIRPVVSRTAGLVDDAGATARTLRGALPTFNDALEIVAGPLRRSAALGDDLEDALGRAGRLVADPMTAGALRGLAVTSRSLQTQLRFYGPHITVCNVINLWTTFVTDVITSPTPTGTGQLGMPEIAFPQDDGVGAMGANEVATGRNALPGATPQHLHSNVLHQAVEADGAADCELGQQGYRFSGNANDDTPDRYYRRAVLDTQAPAGVGQGPGYRRYDARGRGSGAGPARVPDGQTFRQYPGGRAFPEGRGR